MGTVQGRQAKRPAKAGSGRLCTAHDRYPLEPCRPRACHHQRLRNPPSLVYDKSKLNTQRILVCWLSPNYWTQGSRYGNIDFRFDFEWLIEGRNYYWVEAIEDYKIPACRILVTDIYRDLSPQLKRYDPTLGNGPWWFDKSEGKHYYNGRYCLEFMIEAPIPLTMLRSLDFIKHSDRYCAMNRTAPSRCSEFGFSDIQGAARFLTRAAVMGIGLSSLVKDNDTAKSLIKAGVNEFVWNSANKPAGEIGARSPLAIPFARAIMSAYTYGRSDDAKLLAGQFKNLEEFARATAEVMSEVTGVSDWFARPYHILK